MNYNSNSQISGNQGILPGGCIRPSPNFDPSPRHAPGTFIPQYIPRDRIIPHRPQDPVKPYHPGPIGPENPTEQFRRRIEDRWM